MTIRSTQNLLRSEHERLIMDSLIASPKSCSELSKILGISNTAVKICIVELSSAGLVRRAPDSSPSSHFGRRPIRFEVNGSIGVFCVLSIGIEESQVVLHNLLGETISTEVIACGGKITKNTLDTLKGSIQERLEGLVPPLPLLNITVSTPGKIDSEGHYFFARHIDDYEAIDFPSFLASFKVPVHVYKDTNLGCLGEKFKGSFSKEEKNVYYAYIGYEGGGSLYLDGSVYHGSHGFAGEVSSFSHVDDLSSSSEKGAFFTLENIEERIGEGHIGLKAMKERVASHDKKTIEALTFAAKKNALELLAISNLLDVEAIVVGGPIVTLGPSFTSTLSDCFKEYDANKGECILRISSLPEAAIMGGYVKGKEDFYATTFASLAKKRSDK